MKNNFKYIASSLFFISIWFFVVIFVYIRKELESPSFTPNTWSFLDFIIPKENFTKEKVDLFNSNAPESPLYSIKEVSSSSDGIIEDKKISWFAQITDIHISRWGNGKGGENFHKFLNHVLPGLRPLFVTLTGDITDAKGTHYWSRLSQNTEEWDQYQFLLKDAGVSTNSSFWFDLPGNHDKYGFIDETTNFISHFEEFGVMSSSDYGQVFHLPWDENIALVALDATTPIPLPGPIAFYGFLKGKSVLRYKKQCEEISKLAKNTTLITISHYPTSCMQVEYGRTFMETLSTFSTALISGHLHKLAFGLGEDMYIRRGKKQPFLGDSHPSSPFCLDLECGDMKDHATFRILSTDNNVFSISEQSISSNIWIHVLSPLNGKINSTKHDFDEVRVLIFTPGHPSFASKIIEAKVWIDDATFQLNLSNHAGGPLWSAKLPPLIKLSKGKHTILVRAKDDASFSETKREDFFIPEREGSLQQLVSFSSIISMWCWDLIICLTYWIFYLICCFIMLYFIFVPPKNNVHPILIFSIFLFHLYTAIGPILISYVHESFTIIFLWGVWRERWVKILDTWVFSGVVLLGFHYIPSYICIIMAYPRNIRIIGLIEMICISIITLHYAFLILTMTTNYGLFSIILSPGIGIHYILFVVLYSYLKFFRFCKSNLKKD